MAEHAQRPQTSSQTLSRTSQRELPRHLRPMLAVVAHEPFDSQGHLFEVKWDGIRALAFIDAGGYRLCSRRHRDLTAQFPELEVLAGLPPGTVLDGELVVFRDGRPHLGSMLARQATDNPFKVRCLARSAPVSYVVFDQLYARYRSVIAEPLRNAGSCCMQRSSVFAAHTSRSPMG